MADAVEVKCHRCHGNGGDSRGPCDRCGTLGVVERKAPEPSPQMPLIPRRPARG